MINIGLRYFIVSLLLVAYSSSGLYAQVPGRVDTLFNRVDGFEGQPRNGLTQSDGTVIIYGNFIRVSERLINRISKLNTDGTNDYTFNPGTGANGQINNVKLQPDGKLILGGAFTQYNSVTTNRLCRIAQNGTKDGTFSANINNTVYDIELQSDGKMIVVGAFTNVNSTSAINRIVRLNSDGTRDASFNVGTGFNNTVYSAAIQANGKVIVSGDFTSYKGVAVNRIARLNTDGSLDNTFNNGGNGLSGPANDICILNNGKILIGGNFVSYNGTTANRFLCLDTIGTRDSTFSIGTGFNNVVQGILSDNNGKVVITGFFTTYKGASYSRIVRVDTTGTPDTTFVIGSGFQQAVYGVFSGLSTDIFVAGDQLLYNNYASWGLTKISTNGSRDHTFMARSGFNRMVWDAAVQSDGKIVVVGDFTRYNDLDKNYILRFNLDGTIDNTFNSGGSGTNVAIRAIGIQSDDKIVIGGGFSSYNGNSSAGISRLNSDGSYDNTFQKGTGFNCCLVNTIVVLPNDKIFVGSGAGSYNGTSSPRLIKLNADGTKDNSFDIGTGFVNGSAGVLKILVQDDGSVIAAGDFHIIQGQARRGIAKLNPDGTLDATFNAKSTYDIKSVALQPDGKILVGGYYLTFDGVSRVGVARLNSDGTLDVSYNPSGAAFNTDAGFWPNDIQYLSSGALCGGSLGSASNSKLIFLNDLGGLNTEFEQGGANNGAYSDPVVQRVFKDDRYGRILVMGYFTRLQSRFFAHFSSLQNYINELEINTALCAGATTKLYYNKGVTFNTGNVFTIQLSNASGSFSSPVTIGIDTTDGWGPDSIQVTIPSGTVYGTGYKVRIVSTSPVFTSLSSWPITINAPPLQKTVLQAQAEVYPSLGTEVKIVASQTGVHYSLMNDTTVVDTGSGNGDTLRLDTKGIYNTTDFTIVAHASGCSRILDTIVVDTLSIIPVSWLLEDMEEHPDHSLHVIVPNNGKPTAMSYNFMGPGEDGVLLFRFESGNTYDGMFGLISPEYENEIFLINVLESDTDKGWDSTGLYLSINKEEPIFRRAISSGPIDVAIHKLGNVGHVYFNGIMDTVIVLDSTLYYLPVVNPFSESASIKGVYSSYHAVLHGTVSAQNMNCGDKGAAEADISGGSPPYSFYWSNGDTTDAPDSLEVGMYILTVTDFANDTLIDSVYVGYNGLIDTTGNIEPDSLGRMVSVNNTSPYSSYAWYTNTLEQGQDGWVEFMIPEGTFFQGYLGMGTNKLLDETTYGAGILILGDDILFTSNVISPSYVGHYEMGEGYRLRVRYEADNIYYAKFEDGWNEVSFPFVRTEGVRPGIVPMANGSILPSVVSTFSCNKMFVNVTVASAATISSQGQARLDVKGGTPPYTYLWSNAATTAVINAVPGTYTVTITDQNSVSITSQAFIGTYVQWLASNNVEENGQHEIVGTANLPTGYNLQYNYIFGANALKPGHDGTVSFDFEKAGDFAGSLGFATDYQLSYGSQGFGVVVLQDRMNMGIDQDLYYISEDGDLEYFGSFNEQVAMNIKVRKAGNDIEVIKNDVGGIIKEFAQPYTFYPFVSPVFTGDKITRITTNYGVPVQSFESVQNVSCAANTLGSISLDVIGGQPPYHYNWANGDTTSNPDSLSIGLHTVMVWDSQMDTIVDSIYVGYEITWDTTDNVDDTLGMLVSTGNNSTVSFNSYAYGLNSLAPGEDGWVEFILPENIVFNGALSMTANKYYDETSEGLALNIVEDHIMLSGSMLENSEGFTEYKKAVGYRLRMDFIGDDIVITAKDLLGLAPGWQEVVNYERTKAWSPSIIFGLNGAQVTSVSSSFGCGKIHAETRIEPAAKDGEHGSIYTEVKGGVPPYIYTWSNSATSSNLINVPIGRYTVTVEDQMGDEEVVHTFLGRQVDWDVLSGMEEEGAGVVYEGDTVDFDSTIVYFAFAKNAIKESESGTVSFDFERTKDFTGVLGLAEKADLSESQDGALMIMAVIGDIDEDKQLYVFDESGSPAYFGKLRENLPVNLQMKRTPLDFTVTKNGISDMVINRATTASLSPVVVPGLPGDRVQRVTCDFGQKLKVVPIVTPVTCGTTNTGAITVYASGGIPPYDYYWNTGDTTDTNDSLTIGSYSVTVVDSIGDSTSVALYVGYRTTWSGASWTYNGTTQQMSMTGVVQDHEALIVSGNVVPAFDTTWIDWEIDTNSFQGIVGLYTNANFDITTLGIGFEILQDKIYLKGTGIPLGYVIGEYITGKKYRLRIALTAVGASMQLYNDANVLVKQYMVNINRSQTLFPIAIGLKTGSVFGSITDAICTSYTPNNVLYVDCRELTLGLYKLAGGGVDANFKSDTIIRVEPDPPVGIDSIFLIPQDNNGADIVFYIDAGMNVTGAKMLQDSILSDLDSTMFMIRGNRLSFTGKNSSVQSFLPYQLNISNTMVLNPMVEGQDVLKFHIIVPTDDVELFVKDETGNVVMTSSNSALLIWNGTVGGFYREGIYTYELTIDNVLYKEQFSVDYE